MNRLCPQKTRLQQIFPLGKHKTAGGSENFQCEKAQILRKSQKLQLEETANAKVLGMTEKRVTLVTCSQYPNLEPDDDGLVEALQDLGLEVQIELWDDPKVDWEAAGVCVVRSVRDYAEHREQFIAWSKRVPKLLNPADVLDWATDKHYLDKLHELGVPVVPTTWLEPESKLSKHQVHTRFPAHGDFVVKPAVSSGGRGMGRYTANDGESRMKAINHACAMLNDEISVMVQRYLAEVDIHGEISLVYINGVLSHCVEKEAMLQPAEFTGEELQSQAVRSREPNPEEWQWGERVRRAVHSYIKERVGHDQQLLYMRIDVVHDGKGSFYLMEVSPVDAVLYLHWTEDGVRTLAEAIAARVLWQ